MRKCLESLDARADKQKFLEYNNAAFMAPKKFMFQVTNTSGDRRTLAVIDVPCKTKTSVLRPKCEFLTKFF